MGYKLAGYDLLGNCEIDPQMMKIYRKNHNPKYPFLMDIRDFNKMENLPDELFDLDIFDGSPPCSVFSIAGDREKAWGKEKAFREGQAKQSLDDLFFHYLDAVERLRPKIFWPRMSKEWSVEMQKVIGKSVGFGKVTGRISADHKVLWRLDYDPEKGSHINVEDYRNGKGDKAKKVYIPFEGNEKTYKTLLRHLNK